VLRISATVQSHSSTPSSELQFQWEEVAEGLDLTLPTVSASSLDGPKLAIRHASLIPGRRYTFQLTVTDPDTPSGLPGGGRTHTTVTVRINAPPTPGRLSVFPDTGVALMTSFILSCDDWSDPEGDEPLAYRFAVIISDDNNQSQPERVLVGYSSKPQAEVGAHCLLYYPLYKITVVSLYCSLYCALHCFTAALYCTLWQSVSV
jgi:hypothetical protein